MTKVQGISDPRYVSNQYRDGKNLNARIRLHQEFSTNKYGWQRWLFEQIKIAPNSRVLELGCGIGNLWLENLQRIPAGVEITLSDQSAGMVDQAQKNLKNAGAAFQFEISDAQSIPFGQHSFDIVIASHMLYHVPDRERALREIKRVLKPKGRLYASTIGCDHLKELTELVSAFDRRLSTWGKLPADSFDLESGASELGKHFTKVSLFRYPDALVVTDLNLLLDYVFSGRLEVSAEEREVLVEHITRAFMQNGGKLYISKDSGVFEAYNLV